MIVSSVPHFIDGFQKNRNEKKEHQLYIAAQLILLEWRMQKSIAYNDQHTG